MAIKSTIFKANLQIADIDHGYYADHALTLARHPSETDERMMVRLAALALNAQNDPFVPAASLPRAGEVGRHVTLWQPPEGGHVGFCQGRAPGHVFWLPRAVGGWLLAQAEVPARAGHASS